MSATTTSASASAPSATSTKQRRKQTTEKSDNTVTLNVLALKVLAENPNTSFWRLVTLLIQAACKAGLTTSRLTNTTLVPFWPRTYNPPKTDAETAKAPQAARLKFAADHDITAHLVGKFARTPDLNELAALKTYTRTACNMLERTLRTFENTVMENWNTLSDNNKAFLLGRVCTGIIKGRWTPAFPICFVKQRPVLYDVLVSVIGAVKEYHRRLYSLAKSIRFDKTTESGAALQAIRTAGFDAATVIQNKALNKLNMWLVETTVPATAGKVANAVQQVNRRRKTSNNGGGGGPSRRRQAQQTQQSQDDPNPYGALDPEDEGENDNEEYSEYDGDDGEYDPNADADADADVEIDVDVDVDGDDLLADDQAAHAEVEGDVETGDATE